MKSSRTSGRTYFAGDGGGKEWAEARETCGRGGWRGGGGRGEVGRGGDV